MLFLFFSCKTLDDVYLTPDWVNEKIDLIENECYYDGSSVTLYEYDSVKYYDFNFPRYLWPQENVFFEDGTQVEWQDSIFTYLIYKKNRQKVKTIWTFSDDVYCPEYKD